MIQYGLAAQKKIADFSGSALGKVRINDIDGVGNMLTGLTAELKEFSVDNTKSGFLGHFKKAGNTIAKLISRYYKVEANADKICEALKAYQIILLKHIAILEKMYEMNISYFKELSMYIQAGKIKLNEVIEKELPRLKEKADPKFPEDAKKASDLSDMANDFDKRLHDLELTRMVSVQMGPQIRLVQNNDSLMAQKIKFSLVDTIPLWKSQMELVLGIADSLQAIKAQCEVNGSTNELLRKDAETLKMKSIKMAKKNKRGIVNIEILTQTNQILIETVDEILKIQNEGSGIRRAAEAELGRIETELKKYCKSNCNKIF